MTESEYQEIVAGYPKLDQTEKEGYEQLCRLCTGNQNLDKVLRFISMLKDYRSDVNEGTTLNVILDFLDENDIHFIMSLDWRSGIEDLDWRIKGALQQNFDRDIDLPSTTTYPSDASISYNHVFTDFDTALRNEGFQISMINEGSDSYNLLVHKIADKEKIAQSVEKIGYLYDDFTDYKTNIEIKPRRVSPQSETKPKRKSLFIHIGNLILCPFFSYAAYKGYLKEGLSLSVAFVGFSNPIFYGIGIRGIVLWWKQKKKS